MRRFIANQLVEDTGFTSITISRVDGHKRRVCTVDDVSETCVDFNLDHSDFIIRTDRKPQGEVAA